MKRKRPTRSPNSKAGPRAKPRTQPRAAGRKTGKLRIIGGEYRRRQLPVPDLPGLRPTPDRVRETLFNWLGQALYGRRVLDAFAGTGALGIEALSRGAAEVVFIERDAGAAAQLQDNLATLKAEGGHVQSTDAQALLGRANADAPFDLVLLDPPFHQGLAEPICRALEAGGWLAPEALIYVETEAELAPAVPATWQLYRETRAGEGIARLYQRNSG